MNRKYKIICTFFVAFLCFSSFSQTKTSTTMTKEKSARELAREREQARLERKEKADKQDAYEEAVEMFQLNKPKEAIPLLEAFLGDEKTDAYNPDVYVYLSVAYFQEKEYQKSIDVCELGLSKENTNFKVLYYNEGNASYALGWYKKASELYTKSLEIDANYPPAILNIANSSLRQDDVEKARENYVRYLEVKPETEQRPEIEKMIALLDEEIAYRAKLKPELVQTITNNEEDSFTPSEIMSENETYAPELPIERNEKEAGETVDSDDTSAPELPKEQRTQKNRGETVNSDDTSAPELPKEQRTQKNRGETVDSDDTSAPELPKEQRTQKNRGETVDSDDTSAPELPKEQRTQKNRGETVDSDDTSAPELPKEQRTQKNRGETVDSDDTSAPELPKEQRTQKAKSETVDSSDTKAPELPKDKKKEKMEKIGNQEPPKLPEDSKAKKDEIDSLNSDLPEAGDFVE